jgi:hypothetical protein
MAGRWEEWKIHDFSAGLLDKQDDNLLPDNAARDVQNFVARKVGSLVKRRGQQFLNTTPLGGPVQGLYAYYYGVSRRLVVVAGGTAYYWDPGTGAFVSIRTGLDNTAPVLFATCVSYMVAANGVDHPWKWNGVVASNLANAPADGQFPLLHKEQLFMVPASEPSKVKWSAPFEPENWPPVNEWAFKEGDGDRITCLYPFLGELVIFKRYSIHTLRGTTLDDFRSDELESRVGAVGPRAVTHHRGYLYFVSDAGICVWNGIKYENLIEDTIPGFWATVNHEHLHKACAGVWNDLIWFALPEGTSSYNNVVLVYDPPADAAAGGSWWVWRGINASCFLEYDDGSFRHFYAGGSMDGYVREQDVGTTDCGVAIEAFWVGKAFDVGAAERVKRLRKAYVVDSPGANDVNLQVSLDYGDFQSLVAEGGDVLLRPYRFPTGSECRYLRPKFYHNASTSCEVRGLMVEYIPKPYAR